MRSTVAMEDVVDADALDVLMADSASVVDVVVEAMAAVVVVVITGAAGNQSA